jgi:hypothetical protein
MQLEKIIKLLVWIELEGEGIRRIVKRVVQPGEFFLLSVAPNFQQERSSLQLSIQEMFGDATLGPYKLDSEIAGIFMPLAIVQLKSKRLFLLFLYYQ